MAGGAFGVGGVDENVTTFGLAIDPYLYGPDGKRLGGALLVLAYTLVPYGTTTLYKSDHPDVTDFYGVVTPIGVRDTQQLETRPVISYFSDRLKVYRAPNCTTEHLVLWLGR